MPARPGCPDDPATILQKHVCLTAVSRNMRGELKLGLDSPHACPDPKCETLATTHRLVLRVSTHSPCDVATALDGKLTIDRLVTVYAHDGLERGFHAGDFVWDLSGGIQILGRLSGVTNVGTHRPPLFQECQVCDERGVMEGRLCGEFKSVAGAPFNRCQIIAAYRIKFKPSKAGGNGPVRGTLEGVMVCPCLT